MSSLSAQNLSVITGEWVMLDAVPPAPMELRRVVGTQSFWISSPLSNIVYHFWISGGVNKYIPDRVINYVPSKGAPSPSFCSVVKIAPKPKSIYTDVFRVSTVEGIVLIFRFSPNGSFAPILEKDPTSVVFGSVFVNLLALIPSSYPALVVENGYYRQIVNRRVFSYISGPTDLSLPQELLRIIGPQLWIVRTEGTPANTEIDECRFIVNYGNKTDVQGYIGLISPLANARVSYEEGATLTSITSQTFQLEREIEYQVLMTKTGRTFIIKFDPDSLAPTIRLLNPPFQLNSVLTVLIHSFLFNLY
jgi:hypothetical protein